jgi:hypothetical protein
MKAVFASLVGLAALLVGGAETAAVAVLLTPLLSVSFWLLRPIHELEPEPAGLHR